MEKKLAQFQEKVRPGHEVAAKVLKKACYHTRCIISVACVKLHMFCEIFQSSAAYMYADLVAPSGIIIYGAPWVRVRAFYFLWVLFFMGL